MKSIKNCSGLLLALAFLATCAPSFAEVQPGDLITPANAAKVKELVSPGVYYKVVNGMSMRKIWGRSGSLRTVSTPVRSAVRTVAAIATASSTHVEVDDRRRGSRSGGTAGSGRACAWPPGCRRCARRRGRRPWARRRRAAAPTTSARDEHPAGRGRRPHGHVLAADVDHPGRPDCVDVGEAAGRSPPAVGSTS